MSILPRIAPVATLAAFMTLALPVPGHDVAVAASKKTSGAADAAAAAKRYYEGGVKAYQAGQHQNAVDQLSSALRGGGLSSAEMARGLYYRGLSYKKLSKPGLAISDITSALWLKNGLSDDERKMATAERADAYKAAGLGDGNSGADQVAASDPKSETPAPAAPAPAPVSAAAAPAAAPSPAPVATSQYASTSRPADTGGVPQPLSMGAETAIVPPPPNASAVAGTSAPQPTVSAASADGAQPEAAAQTTGIAGFFSNLFSSGSSAPAPTAPAVEASGVTTASTTQATPQTSSWPESSSLTQGSAKPAAKPTKTAAATAAAPAPVAAAAPAKASQAKTKGGKYKLHIAALRSRASAEALAQKLTQEHAGDLHDRQPSVDEAVIGSMGTFYRVRVGSYKTAEEPRELCNTLRNSGYDCLVVSN